MAKFIDEGGRWNEEELHTAFPRFEVEEILNIPIYLRAGKDNIFWNWEKTERYSVKTGYQLEMGFFKPHMECSSLSLLVVEVILGT